MDNLIYAEKIEKTFFCKNAFFFSFRYFFVDHPRIGQKIVVEIIQCKIFSLSCRKLIFIFLTGEMSNNVDDTEPLPDLPRKVFY
jgi:hypothetical protein